MSGDLSGFSLIDLFRGEAEQQVALLSEGILALESGPADPATVEPLMRAAHSLKGAARIVGMTAAEQISHALEDVFVAAQKGKIRLEPQHVDVLLRAVDLLGSSAAVDEAELPGWLEARQADIQTTIEVLHSIQSGSFSSDRATAPAPAQEPPAAEPVAAEPEPDRPDTAEASETAKPRSRRRTERKSKPEPAVDAPKGVEPAPEPDLAEPAAVAAAPAPRTPAPQPVVEAEPTVASAPRPSSRPQEAADRVVRVSADNMNRLLGLAGEALVEARQFRPVVDSLGGVKTETTDLWTVLQTLDEQLASDQSPGVARARAGLEKARQQVARALEGLGRQIDRLERHARRSEELSERLHHEVIASRLRPMSDGARGFPRLVRDVARQLGKQVRFELLGENTGVDRDILEKLEAPLSHLIRNAVDHGIEMPADREAVGKPATATVRLEARHAAGMLQITLSDDGRGIDVERIRDKIVERNMLSPAMAVKLSEPELLEFLFLSGFTTRTAVTDISGRGVGLDVVQTMVQGVGGSVRVTSTLGQGTCFSLQLPITMSVIRALLVRIAGEPYAFPLSRLDRIASVPRRDVEVIEGRQFFTLDGRTIGLVSAAQVLERPVDGASDDLLPIVVVSDRGLVFGIVVDAFLGESDLDVRPLDTRLGKVPNINSASVLPDGSPVLIIDVEDLVRSIDNLLGGRRLASVDLREQAAQAAAGPPRVLVVDDSITVRELERQLLEGRGYQVDVAIDGVDGWNSVRGGHYDLVVSDVDMPRMDGIQMVALIKRDPRFKSLPVVIVSYKDREEDRLRGLDAGADAYLTKSSFHDQTFLQTVTDLIGEARGRAS